MKALRCKVLRGLVVVAACSTIAPAMAADTVRMTVFPTTVAATPAAGLKFGYFADQGIKLKIKWAHRGRDTIEGLGAGQVDVGLSAMAGVLAARAKGLPLVVIGLHSHGFPGYMVAANKYANLKTLADFKGKRIGLPVGSGVHTVLLMAMKDEGLNPKDFKILNARPPDMPAAMQSGAFDAILSWMPYSSRIVAMGFGKVVMYPSQFEKIVGITYPMVVLTTEKEIKTRPKVLQHFMNAWAKANRYVHLHHAATAKLLRATLGDRVKALSDKTLLKVTYTYHHDRVALNAADIAGIRKMAAFLHAQKKIKSIPNMDKLIDNSFANKAEAALK